VRQKVGRLLRAQLFLEGQKTTQQFGRNGVGRLACNGLSLGHICRLELGAPHCNPIGGSLYADPEGVAKLNQERKPVPARPNRLKKQKKSPEASRFTPNDIVRAIEAVHEAGLTVYSVEITLNGSMRIHTTSPLKRAAAPKLETSAEALDDVQPNKKRA
jgi:hypothetical protein